jgi:hypothetical protein
MKGFLFTVDAILALSLLTLSPLMVSLVVQESASVNAMASMQQLGFDCLASGASNAECEALTGFGFNASVVEIGGSVILPEGVAARHIEPMPFCFGKGCVGGFDGVVESEVRVT